MSTSLRPDARLHEYADRGGSGQGPRFAHIDSRTCAHGHSGMQMHTGWEHGHNDSQTWTWTQGESPRPQVVAPIHSGTASANCVIVSGMVRHIVLPELVRSQATQYDPSCPKL